MGGGIEIKAQKALEKAREALSEAEVLFEKQLFAGTVSRSYYVVFHAACALLQTENLEFSKHSAVIAALGHRFAKKNIIDKRYHRIAIEMYDARQIAEYDIFKRTNRQFAGKALTDAGDFLQMAETYVRSNNPGS